LKTDEFITHDDLKHIWSCEAGEVPKLDESTDDDKYQGDMVLPRGKEGKAMLAQFKAAFETGKHAGTPWNTNGQPGRVPFCYHSSANEATKHATQQTVNMIREQIPCMEMVEVDFGSDAGKFGSCVETPSIVVRADNLDGDGCYSYVGMLSVQAFGGSQVLNIGSGCETTGIVAHEFGHAFGMGHEHSRSDRDAYITVHEDYILANDGPDWLDQVKKEDDVDTTIPYDILSLMHYGANSGWITVNSDPDLTAVLGQRLGFSESDIYQLGSLYSCSETVSPLVSNAVIMDRAQFPGCYQADNSKKPISSLPADDAMCAPADCPPGAEWHDWAKTHCQQMCDFCAPAPSPAGSSATGRPTQPPGTQAPAPGGGDSGSSGGGDGFASSGGDYGYGSSGYGSGYGLGSSGGDYGYGSSGYGSSGRGSGGAGGSSGQGGGGAGGTCVTMKMTNADYAGENSWSLGDCSSPTYSQSDDNKVLTQQCCLAEGVYHLTCADSYGDGWHGGKLEIDDETVCEVESSEIKRDYTIGGS
jgi:hypothetical protein